MSGGGFSCARSQITGRTLEKAVSFHCPSWLHLRQLAGILLLGYYAVCFSYSLPEESWQTKHWSPRNSLISYLFSDIESHMLSSLRDIILGSHSRLSGSFIETI